MGRGHAALPGPRPGAVRRRRARRRRPRSIGFEEKPDQPKSDLIPIGVYFLRPDAFDVIEHLAAVGPRRVRDHRRPQPLHPRAAACTARVFDGHWTDAGTVPSLLRAAELAAEDDDAGRLAAAGQPAGRREPGRGAGRVRRRLLVTGGAGFIGSCYVRDVLGAARRHPDHRPRQADLRRQRGEPRAGPRRPRAWRRGCASSAATSPTRRSSGRSSRAADAVVNFAAESHVDRSILDPEAFLRTGVIGVHVLLEACRERRAGREPRFLQVSTDEVYGSVETGHAGRGRTRSRRARPYAAAKAAGELLVRSYVVTHGVDAVVTRGSNTYGPYHHPEKLIPLFITNALDDQPLPLYGDGLQRRDWLYVADHAAAIDHVLRHGDRRRDLQRAGRRPSGRTARSSALLLERLGKPWSLVRAGRGSAGPRPALRDGRLEAGRPRLAAADRVRGRARARPSTGTVANEAVVAGDPLGRLGRATTSASTAAGWPAARPPRRRPSTGRLMRVAVTGAGGRLGRRARGRAGGRAVHRPGRADRLDPARRSTSTHPTGRRPPRAGPAGGRRPCRGLDRRRRLRPGPRPRPATERRRRPGSWPRPVPAAGVDLVAVSTNEVFDGSGPTGVAIARTTRRVRGTHTARASWPARPRPAPRTSGRRRPRPGDRPDRLAVRAARQRLPDRRSSARRCGPGGPRRR